MAETEDIERTGLATPVPQGATLDRLRAAAVGCTACPLYRNATQTVFGEGPAHAAILLVG